MRTSPTGKRSPAAVGDQVEVHIDSLGAGGDGVGRDAHGRVTFVPYTAPGDRVLAQVFEARKDYARALPVELVVASGFRVEALCPHFVARTCGGCQWLHIGESVQASAKDELVARVLRKHVQAGMELYPLRAEVPPYGWRRRARLHWFRPRKAGAAVIGFFGPRSHHVSDITGCLQLEPALARTLEVLRQQLAPALGRQGTIEVLAGHLGEVHVVIRGRCAEEAAAALVGQGPIAGVMLDPGVAPAPGPRQPRARADDGGRGRGAPGRPGKRRMRQWGEPHIELEPGFLGRADWFAQPSRAGNRVLLEVVEEAAQPRDQRVLELYAGSGNLSRILAPQAAALVAVERRRPPWKLPEPLARALVPGDVVEVTRGLADQGERFDLAVLDPPRTGAREVLAPLAALGPARIVYVSCDPATLARDLDLLAGAGYRAAWAQPLDLMPQTAHVEIVTVIERG